jgi:hypothetical protein
MRFECRSFVWRIVNVCLPAGAAERDPVRPRVALAAVVVARNSRRVKVFIAVNFDK